MSGKVQEAVYHGTEDQKADGGFIKVPVDPVETQEKLLWRKMDDEQSHKKAHIQLLIPEREVRSPLLGMQGTDAGKYALERIDSEAAGMQLEVLGQCGHLGLAPKTGLF